jgi:hypothetical protein
MAALSFLEHLPDEVLIAVVLVSGNTTALAGVSRRLRNTINEKTFWRAWYSRHIAECPRSADATFAAMLKRSAVNLIHHYEHIVNSAGSKGASDPPTSAFREGLDRFLHCVNIDTTDEFTIYHILGDTERQRMVINLMKVICEISNVKHAAYMTLQSRQPFLRERCHYFRPPTCVTFLADIGCEDVRSLKLTLRKTEAVRGCLVVSPLSQVHSAGLLRVPAAHVFM